MKLFLTTKNYYNMPIKSFILLFAIIFLINPVSTLAWSLELKRAIFQLYQGTASTKQINLLRQHNDIINNMANTGHIRNDIYQKVQSDFRKFNFDVSQRVANKNGLQLRSQTSIKAPTPGTDSDYITTSKSGKMKISQIKNTIKDYNIEMNKKFNTKNIDYAKKLNSDFMADQEQMTEKEFKKVSKLNNDAYKRRASAKYELKVRTAGKSVTIEETFDYKKDMNDLISKKSSEIKQLREKLSNVMKNDPYEMKLTANNLKAKLQIKMQQQAKYIQRYNDATLQTAKKYGIKIKPNFSDISSKGANRSTKPENGMTSAEIAKQNRINSSTSNALKDHLVQQSKSGSIKVDFEAGMKTNQKLLLNDAADQLSKLTPSKQGEVIQEIRHRLGDKAADNLLSRTREFNSEISATKRKTVMKADAKKAVSKYMKAALISSIANEVRAWVKGEKSNKEAAEFGLNMVSMGYYSTGKNLSEWETGWKEMEDLEFQAYDSSKQARILQIAKALDQYGVNHIDIKQIVRDMQSDSEDTLDKVISNLNEKGFKYRKPNKIEKEKGWLEYGWDYGKGAVSRATDMGWGIISSPFKLAWGTGNDIGELVVISTDIYKLHRNVSNREFEIIEMQNEINSERLIRRLISQGASPKESKEAVTDWLAGRKEGLQKLKKLLKESKELVRRDLYIRLFEYIDDKRTTNIIKADDIEISSSTYKRSANSIKTGGYKFANLKPDEYRLIIKVKGYKARSGSDTLSMIIKIPKPNNNQKQQPIIKTLYMVPSPIQLTIVVSDDQGDILPNADIALQGNNWRSSKTPSIDNSNRFVFKDVPPGKYKISVTAPGYHPLKDGSIISINASKDRVVKKIKLIPFLSTVKIIVIDALDQPVKDAKITLAKNTGTTDIQGEFTFSSVRPGKNLKISAKKEGHASITTSFDIIPTQQNEEFTLRVTLQGGVPLTVKVIDDESKKILTGVTVQLSYADEHATAISDEKGLARFNSLTPYFIYISASLPGYQPVSRVEKDLSSAKAGEEQTAVIKLTEGMEITVYVKDDKGELLPMGYISMDEGPFLPSPTGSRVFTPVKEGKHTFQGRAKKFAEAIIFYNAKPKDKTSDTVSLKLLPGATITVEVRDERGAFLRGASTRITLFKNGKSFKTGTGPARMFANLESATYNARAVAKDYISTASRKIKYNGDPQAFHGTLKITLSPKVSMSTLRVKVTAKDEKGNLSQGAANIKLTGSSGSFTENDMIGNFSDLLPGKYTVTASVKGFKSKTKTLTITSDNPREIYTLSFNLSKDIPNEPKVKKKLPQLNCCDDDTDECITANIINKMNYCREICEGIKAGCYQNCQKNINCGDGSREAAPEKVIPDTIRTIPGNKSSGSSSSMKIQREKNALNNKLNFLIKTNKTNSSEFKNIIQRLKEINK